MFFTYLRRELGGRKKQTIIIAAGMALAIALVIIVTAVSAGVKSAQAATLASVYGVGTDITVTETQQPGTGTGGQQFAFGGGDGTTDGGTGTRQISQNQLHAAMGSSTYSTSVLKTVLKTDGVKDATATLALQNTSFSGTVPTQGQSGGAPAPQSGSDSSNAGSNFSVDSFTVTGIDASTASVGPMSSAELVKGRMLKASDAGKDVVVLDKTYATSNDLKVGGTLKVGDSSFTVVGIVASTSSDASTAADSYIPLDTAQELADLSDKVTTVYVSADSASDVSAVQTALVKALPKAATVSTQADLASTVSGSLSTASGLISGLGIWLSVAVLIAAFLIATLFTLSGVTRRTREFGTLKAIGWRNGRIVRQVAGEALIQGLIGGVAGVAVGLIGILVINIISPILTSGAATADRFAGGAAAGGGPGEGAAGAGGGAARALGQAATDVALHAPVTAGIILLAVGLSVLGGLLAGVIGGWRASRLRPAEALRSVA